MKKDSLEARYEQIIESAQQILGESSDEAQLKYIRDIAVKNNLKDADRYYRKRFDKKYFPYKNL